MLELIRKYFHNATDNSRHKGDLVESTPELSDAKPAVTFEKIKDKITFTEKDIVIFARSLLSLLAKEMEISQGIFFIIEKKGEKKSLKFLAGYAYESEDNQTPEIEFGEGFPGQVAVDGVPMIISEVPHGYLSIVSGLGKATPASIIIIPVINGKETIAVLELASFKRFAAEDESVLMEVSSYIAPLIKKIATKK